jgi:predicted dehydrogenase
MTTPLRIGLLGAARISAAAIIAPTAGRDDVAITAIAARDPDRARAFAATHDIAHVHTSYRELIADPDVDAVYNALPNGLHGVWTIAAVQAGKHVLCEKPLAANADEAAAVADAAAQAERVVMEAFHWRYHPLALRVLELVRDGAIGDLRRVEADFVVAIPDPENIRWRLDLAGGSLMDLGCYAVSFVRAVTSEEPRVVRARARQREAGVDRFLAARLVTPSGVRARIVCGMQVRRRTSTRARVIGSDGTIAVANYISSHHDARIVVTRGRRRDVEELPTRSTYDYQLDAFVAAVRDGAPIPTDAADGVANMAVIDACYRAAGLPLRQPTPTA